MIRFENVSKKFQDNYAIRDVSINISQGEKFVLLGTSGSGKSTVLKHINFLLTPTQGQVFVQGKDLSTVDKIQLRRNTGYIIQNAGLFPHYTVKDNIALIPRLNGADESILDSKVKQLMASVKLDIDLMNKFPRELSGGQIQRVGIARALAGDPEVLLLDEPLSALDPITKAHIQEDFIHLDELKSKTMVWVTHDIKEALKVGDRICLLDQGKIQQIGSTKEFLLNPQNSFVNNFFSSDRLTFLIQTLSLADLASLVKDQNNPEMHSVTSFESSVPISSLFDRGGLPEQISISYEHGQNRLVASEKLIKTLIKIAQTD